MTKEIAIINLQLANILPFDKNSKGYIQYNKYISTAQVALGDVIDALEVLTSSNNGEGWGIVGNRGEVKVIRLNKEVA